MSYMKPQRLGFFLHLLENILRVVAMETGIHCNFALHAEEANFAKLVKYLQLVLSHITYRSIIYGVTTGFIDKIIWQLLKIK